MLSLLPPPRTPQQGPRKWDSGYQPEHNSYDRPSRRPRAGCRAALLTGAKQGKMGLKELGRHRSAVIRDRCNGSIAHDRPPTSIRGQCCRSATWRGRSALAAGEGRGGNEGEVPAAAGAGDTPELEASLMDCVIRSCRLPGTFWGALGSRLQPPYAAGTAHSLVIPARRASLPGWSWALGALSGSCPVRCRAPRSPRA